MVLLESLFVAKNLLVGAKQVGDVLVLLQDQSIPAFAVFLNLHE